MIFYQALIHFALLETKSYIYFGFPLDINSADFGDSSPKALRFMQKALFTL